MLQKIWVGPILKAAWLPCISIRSSKSWNLCGSVILTIILQHISIAARQLLDTIYLLPSKSQSHIKQNVYQSTNETIAHMQLVGDGTFSGMLISRGKCHQWWGISANWGSFTFTYASGIYCRLVMCKTLCRNMWSGFFRAHWIWGFKCHYTAAAWVNLRGNHRVPPQDRGGSPLARQEQAQPDREVSSEGLKHTHWK